MYIYQQSDWPNFNWQEKRLFVLLSEVRNLQGRVVGKMETFGFEMQQEANLLMLTQDVIKTTEIEGQSLNNDQVRSSVAQKLNISLSNAFEFGRDVEGVVEMMVDATSNINTLLTEKRLFSWHCSLFPGGYSGINKISVGKWRDDSLGTMKVVSGTVGKDIIHYQAPDALNLPKEMSKFLKWFNCEQTTDIVVKAALAHLWFVTIHPFEDGNGRIARAIADMLLAKADGAPFRFYSMSSQIRKERKEYYKILEQTQKGDLDVTAWIEWFVACLQRALKSSDKILQEVIFKHNFWLKNASKVNNERQKKILNKLLNGFEGNITTSKWAKLGKCSQDTAMRDIQTLIDKQVLYKLDKGGRSTAYTLNNAENS
ncbi:MAG: Fic family protein [Kiritimatiellae bacterium]|jgi:Fic family protein|nr:Fic family protein [Kiritimatiellia bacterium]